MIFLHMKHISILAIKLFDASLAFIRIDHCPMFSSMMTLQCLIAFETITATFTLERPSIWMSFSEVGFQICH